MQRLASHSRARLDGQETRSRDIDSDSTVKVFDRSSDGSFQLDDRLTTVRDFVVDDDLKIQCVLIHDSLDALQVAPYTSLAITAPLHQKDNLSMTHKCCWC